MANVTIYPFGISGQQPGGAWPQKIASIQSTLDMLAPLAFRETPNPANPAYIGATIFPSDTNDSMTLRYGRGASMLDYIMSPMIDCGEIGASITMEFSCGEAISSGYYPGVVFFDENMSPSTRYNATADPRMVSRVVDSETKYCRLLFKAQYLIYSYLKVNDQFVFNGADFSTAMIKGKEDFARSQYWLGWGPNSREDWIGWNFTNTTSAATAQRTDFTQPLYILMWSCQYRPHAAIT